MYFAWQAFMTQYKEWMLVYFLLLLYAMGSAIYSDYGKIKNDVAESGNRWYMAAFVTHITVYIYGACLMSTGACICDCDNQVF